jgi:hypothetical protein
VDAAGNLYVNGTFGSTTDLDPGTTVKNVSPVGYVDGFVEKINTNGSLAWVHTYGSKWGRVQQATIGVDSNGNVDASAYPYQDTTLFTIGTGKKAVSGSFAQYDTNGNIKWVSNNITRGPFGLDAAGNIYTNTSKFSPTGVLIWSAPNGAWSAPSGNSIDSAGDIYFADGGNVAGGQINVSPTSTPILIAASTPSEGDSIEIVKWTQPGGYAAASTQQSASALASAAPSLPLQQTIYVGGPSTMPAVPPSDTTVQPYDPLLAM